MKYRYLQSEILTLGLTMIAATVVQDAMAGPPAPLILIGQPSSTMAISCRLMHATD